jgi:hypothetical protein
MLLAHGMRIKKRPAHGSHALARRPVSYFPTVEDTYENLIDICSLDLKSFLQFAEFQKDGKCG